MRTSSDRILATHVGSLPRPDDLIAANRLRESGEAFDEPGFQRQSSSSRGRCRAASARARHRRPGRWRVRQIYGSPRQLSGMEELRVSPAWWARSRGPDMHDVAPRRSRPGQLVLTSFADRRDRAQFAAAYGDPESGVSTGPRPTAPVCVAPLSYTGDDAIKTDIANFKAATAGPGVEEGFMTAVAPGSATRIGNAYYKTDEEFALRLRRCDARGVQGHRRGRPDPAARRSGARENWDMINPEPTVEEYRKFAMVQVEALNHAIRGLPQDRIRFHLCWGSWHGPHTTDIPMRDIVEVMLAINAHAYSFEAGNVRHEHEWKVWQEVKLPDDKLILPGVVSHATNVVEHPELVADRILRFANIVGRERVIASTDCGLGGRIHPHIAWAKLEALAQGAALASRQLWH